MKRIISLLVAVILILGSVFVYGNDKESEIDNLEVNQTYYRIMVYNHSSRNISVDLKNYRSDFGDKGFPKIKFQGRDYNKRLEKLEPGKIAEVVIHKVPGPVGQNWAFNLVTTHWMLPGYQFTPLDQRISKKGQVPSFFHNGQCKHNQELGLVAASAIVYTHSENYDSNSLHEDIVRRMGLDPNKDFGKFMKFAVKTGMNAIHKKYPWGKVSKTDHYYQLTVTDEKKQMMFEGFDPDLHELPSYPQEDNVYAYGQYNI